MTGIEGTDVTVADGLRFHVAQAGRGPYVVLLHGFTGSTETWRALQESLADQFTTLAIDITGHGQSSAPDDPSRYSLPRFADDLRDLLDTLGIARAAVLGYSMGGRAALQFALRHPNRVEGLILESTSPGIADPLERAMRVASDMDLAASIERDGVAAFVDGWERLPLWDSHRSLTDDVRVRLRTQRLTNRPAGLANSLRGAGAGAELPIADRLGDIRTTVRIIAGAFDSKYVEIGLRMQELMPEARLEIVADAGHMVHLERPAVFQALVATFVAGLAWAR